MANGQIRYAIDFDVNQQKLRALKAELQDIQKITKTDIMKNTGMDSAKAGATLDQIRKDAEKVEIALEKAFNPKLNTVNINAFNKKLSELTHGGTLSDIKKNFEQAGISGQKAFTNLANQVLGVNVKLKQSTGLLDKMAVTLGNSIKWNIASSAINGVTRGVQQAWGFTKALDSSLNDIRIVTGKSADEMARFSVQANETAKNLGKTTTDFTNAALIYAQQGLGEEDVQQRARLTLMTANVTGQDAKDVSEELTAVWNGYKVSAEQAEVYIDRLAAIAATTASNLEELSTGMSKVASAAAAMGVGEDQLAAQLSTIISATRQAPQSVGTALRTVYARISDIKAGIDEDGVSLGNYSGKMAALGINVLDMNGRLRDMGEVIEQIGGKWQNLTREQQVNLAQIMAGQRQYNNLLALFDNFDKYSSAMQTAANAQGTLQKQQDIYMDRTTAKLNELKAATEGIYISLTDTDSINGVIDALTTLADLTNNFVQAIGGGAGVLMNLGTIGLTVFNQQLTNGINHFIERQKESMMATVQMQTRIAEARKLADDQTNPLKKESYVRQADALQQFVKKGLSAEDTEIIIKYESQVRRLVDAQKELNSQLEKLTQFSENYSNKLNMQEGSIEDYRESVKKLEENLKEVNKQLKEFNKIGVNKANLESEKSERGSRSARAKIRNQNRQIRQRNTQEIKANLNKNIEQSRNYLSGLNEDGLTEETTLNLAVKIGELNKIKTEEEYKKWRSQVEQILQQQSKKSQTALEVIVNPKVKQNTDFVDRQKQDVERMGNLARTVGEKAGEFRDKIFNQKNIENIGQIVSGISRVSMGIKNLSNVISIIQDKDLTITQKFGQSITAIGMGLPMVISGMQTLATVTKFTFSEIAVITTAIGLVVGAITYLDNQTKALKQSKKAIIEENNKKQESIQKNRELTKSLQELNKEINESNLTRTQVKERIDELIEKYDLQDSQIQKLIHSYRQLGDVAEEIRKEQAQKGKNSAIEERNAARELIQTNFSQTLWRQGKGNYSKETGVFSLTSGGWTNTNAQGRQILEKLGGIQGKSLEGRSWDFDFQFNNIQELVHFYDLLNEQINKLDPSKDKVTIDKLTKLKDSISQGVQAYKQANEDYQKYGTEVQAFANNVKAGSVKNLSDYVRANRELISNIQNNLGIQNQQRAQQLATQEFRTNYKDQWSKYDSQLAYIQELQNSLVGESEEDIQKIANLIGNLQPNALEVLFQVHPQTFTDVEVLKKYLEEMSKMQFDNVESLLGADLSTLLELAQEDYVGYEQILEKIEKGKALSKKEYQGIAPSLQDYFKPGINGTYEIYGNLKAAREQAERLQLAGINKALQAIQQQRAFSNSEDFSEQDGSRQYKGRSFNTLANAGMSLDDYGNSIVNQTQAQASLDYLKNFSFDTGITANIKAFEEQIKEVGTITPQVAKAIQQEVLKTQEVFNMTNEGYDQQTQAVYDMFNQLQMGIEGLDPQALANYTQHLQNIAGTVPELSKDLKDNDAAAKIVAKSIMNMNKGYQQLNKNWEDWSDVLSNSSKSSYEYAEAMSSTKDAVADLLDINKDYISENFIAEHLEEIKEAAQGSETAIDELRSAATEDVIIKIMAENGIPDAAPAIIGAIQDLQANLPDLQVGAQLKNSQFIDGLNLLVQQAGLSADQINAIFDTIGYEPHFVTEYEPVHKQVPVETTHIEQYDTYSATADSMFQGGQPRTIRLPLFRQWTSSDTFTQSTEMVPIPAMANGRTPVIDKITKKAGGNFNNGSSSNKGGSKKSGGGGGGGGGGKTYKPKDKKDLDKSKDHRYHDINQELEKSNELLDSLSKKQSRLSGQAFITNLNQQIKLIEQQIELTEEKINLQKEDLSERKEELAKLGVTFDGDTIANYQAIINARQAEYNALLTEQNELIEQANAAQSDSLDAEIEAKDKQAQNSKKALDEAKKQMDEYEALQKQMREEEAKIEEERQRIIEKQIQKFHYAIQIHLELSEAEKEWNEFKRKVLGKTTVDILMRTDYSEGMDSLNISAANYQTEANKINQLQAHLRDIRDEISIMEDGGTSDIYGDNLKQAYDDLKKYNDQLTKSLGNLQEEIKNAQAEFEKIMSYIDEKFQQYGDDLDFISDSIEHNMELLKLLYGEDNYDAMAKYYEKLKQNQLKSVENSRTAVDFWYNEWQKAIERQDEEGIKNAKERWKNSLKELQSDIQTSAKTIRQEYENAIDGVFDKLEKKMTNGKGFDFLNLEWDLIKDQDDRFLDTVNSAFGLQDLESEFNKAINDAAGSALKGQKALAKLRDEELKKLKEKDKLTQYDLDRAKQRLQVEQARIALEEAQQNKSTMRLRRDSQGNYRYEYVADQNQVLEAQQNYAKAQNDLYNLDKNRRRDLLDDALGTAQEMNEKLAEAEKIQDPTEKLNMRNKITQEYNEKLMNISNQLSENEKNLMHSAFEAMGIDLQTLSDTQANVMMEQMVPTWNNGVSEMAKTMLSSEEGLLPLCQQAFTQLDGITKNYEESLNQLSEKGGEDLSKIKDGATDIADEFEKEVIPKDEEVISQLGRMASDADGVYNNFIKLARGLEPATTEAGRLANEIQRAWENAKKLDAIVDLDDDGGFETSRTNYSDDADVPQTEAVAPVHDNGGGGGSSSSGSRYSPSGITQTPHENPPENSPTRKYKIPTYRYNNGILEKAGSQTESFPYGESFSNYIKQFKVYEDEDNQSQKTYTWKNSDGDRLITLLDPRKLSSWTAYDTGGYTGEWADQSGKLAMLHQKELVLNAQDTKNFLGGISILRDIVKNIGHNLYEKMSNINSVKSLKNLVSSEKSIQQTVHIQASFPNVDSKREIQEALSDLVNLAAQRAMDKK